jgi:hypothetical protein
MLFQPITLKMTRPLEIVLFGCVQCEECAELILHRKHEKNASTFLRYKPHIHPHLWWVSAND